MHYESLAQTIFIKIFKSLLSFCYFNSIDSLVFFFKQAILYILSYIIQFIVHFSTLQKKNVNKIWAIKTFQIFFKSSIKEHFATDRRRIVYHLLYLYFFVCSWSFSLMHSFNGNELVCKISNLESNRWKVVSKKMFLRNLLIMSRLTVSMESAEQNPGKGKILKCACVSQVRQCFLKWRE